MSTISASTTSTTAYNVTADTTGNLVLQTGSGPTTAVTIDTSQNVGIGTASPAAKLDIAGSTGNVQFPSGGNQILFTRVGNNYVSGSGGALNYEATQHIWGPYGLASEWMRINSSGNVGIGTSSPGSLGLSINKTSATATGLQLYQSGTEAFRLATDNSAVYVQNIANIPMQFYTNNTERMRIDTSGNVGIGDTPTGTGRRLTVSNTGFSGGANGLLTLIGGSECSIMLQSTSYGADTNKLILDNATGSWQFRVNSAERMRIDSSGNLLVGGTSTNESFTGIPTIQGSGNCIFTNKRNTTSNASQFRFYNPNGLVGEISTSGSTTTYATSSDYRLKESIQPMTNALAKIAALKPCTYKWKVDGSDGEGFIAHELQAVVPQCVTGEKDAVDADGNPQYQGIDTSFLVATLTAAIQEQQAIINALTERVAALENK